MALLRRGGRRVEFLPKMKIEMAVDDKDAGAVIGMICETAQTGEAWDGKIFVYTEEDIVIVRTGGEGMRFGLGHFWTNIFREERLS